MVLWESNCQKVGLGSTYRELRTIYYARVSWIGDSGKSCSKCSQTTGPLLQQVSSAILSVCLTNNIPLVAERFPRESSREEDMLSRFIDKGD